jgi:LysR family transcriptional regulator of abg operon
MKLNRLRDAAAIAEHARLRAAARALGHAQPALTRSVRELAEQVDHGSTFARLVGARRL